ncbi:TspO/MBR family protein [Halobaculum sp. MBLA0143]|uniref:TspO/MBR family protein n=1 Tax=Halobaculum sp. MBLA0143 TaxID=3079933 RepID=UPI0035258341
MYPPSATFAVAWTTLFTLQGVAVWLVVRSPPGRARTIALAAFVGQFVVNLAWTPTFFGLQAIRPRWPSPGCSSPRSPRRPSCSVESTGVPLSC